MGDPIGTPAARKAKAHAQGQPSLSLGKAPGAMPIGKPPPEMAAVAGGAKTASGGSGLVAVVVWMAVRGANWVRRAVLVLSVVIACAMVMLAVVLAGTGHLYSVPAGALWFELDAGSLNFAQAITQRYVSPALWDSVFVPLLLMPVWQALLAVFASAVVVAAILMMQPWRRLAALLPLTALRSRSLPSLNVPARDRWSDEDMQFMPDVAAAARRSGNRFAYFLTVTVVLFLVIFLVWANLAVLDEVTRGEATVIPSSRIQVVQNLEGGIISEILVREGDIVERGDILVRIDNVLAESSFREERRRYLNLLATIARLEAEIADTEIDFPPQVVEEAPQTIADQSALRNARRDQRDAQVSILTSQADQRRQEIAEMRSRRRQLEQSLSLAREELSITEPLVRQGIVARLDLIRIQRQIIDLDGELRTIRLSIPRAQSAMEEAQKRVAELVATMGVEATREINERRAELESLTEVMTAGRDRVTRTDVRSPVRGTVKELKQNTVGGVIQPGEDILEIVPLTDTLLIEARIRPADIAFLRPGQLAKIKITAYDFSIYGGLDAKVEQISADTIQDEAGENFYRIRLRTEQRSIVHQGNELPIIPGMTASVDILTGEKSVLDYLLKPILKAQSRALRER